MNLIIQKMDQLIDAGLDNLQEDIDIECKLALGKDGKGRVPNSLWETYSAFANTNGGIIILGVKELPSGLFDIQGIDNIHQARSDFFNTINNGSKVNKNILSDKYVREVEIGGKQLLFIAVPRASRKQQPIYLNNNPLNNTYIRQNEGDYRLDDESVKRMLAEQVDIRDDQILVHYGIDDIAMESLKSYRQRYSNLKPHAELNDLGNLEFLRRIGAYGINRETGEEGLTRAGLLMFGMHHVISEVFPNYMIDYQEWPRAQTETRWIDRVVPDGSWSGNLYDFYRKVYSKLVQDLKIPFALKDGIRQEDTPIHIALREALVNSIVHADYSDRASVLIVKRPDMFVFRNPGLMRVPLKVALQGGESDCRNRKLHQMFRLINVGEQAGSGVPKILSGWQSQHWLPPYLLEKREPNNQTLLELTMVDLFPQDTMQQLMVQFGEKFTLLNEEERVALAIAKIEGVVTHTRLQSISTNHSVDISRNLQHLVKEGFLNSTGGRGAVYTLSGIEVLKPEDVFSNVAISSSVISDNSSVINGDSSVISDSSSVINGDSSVISRSEILESCFQARDSYGRFCSDKLEFPIIDDVEKLTTEYKKQLYEIAEEARSKQRLARETMENLILQLCEDQFVTLVSLGKLLKRKPESLRRSYLTKLIKNQQLCLAFPATPTHEKQAYRSNSRSSS
ncbi:AAA family ATPase [Ignatzschineria sp. F8392]|uniref:RNA-binding domain-containing protein n=1 Tax=Ignatzschineria sp. F8392 TaxID=1980117 RepID=UPI000B998BAF|nr:RNA-binding domain-containing protein [Ignatzschineria sp. F8392]OYQ77919.1 AAA family ATPase [Ignatzschineria sp. F8392]